MKTIAEAWASFEAVMNPNAGPVQRKEMKRAFYAGAWAMFNLMIAGDDNEDVALSEMNAWQAECVTFAAAIAKGQA